MSWRRPPGIRLPPARTYIWEKNYPVLYCADGQALWGFADGLPLNSARTLPPIVAIGAHSVPDYRGKEYVVGLDARRFAAHESFFTDELYRWSHSKFALDTARSSCGVFGFSNGAAFALKVGT